MGTRAWRGLAWIAASRARYAFVVGWVAAALAAYLYLPSLSQTENSSSALLVSQHSAAIEAERQSVAAFGYPLLAQLEIVQYNPNGLSLSAQARVVRRAAAIDLGREQAFPRIRVALPILNTAALIPSSRERGTTAITYLVLDPSLSLTGQVRTAEQYVRQRVNQVGDHVVGVTGVAPARFAEGRLISRALLQVEYATVLLIAVIVGLSFRSLGAPLVTLVAAGIAYVLDVRVIAYLALRSGLSVPVELEPLLVVLVLAVTTDYSVFLLSGAQRALMAGADDIAAARNTTIQYTPMIVAAGLTVVGSTLCLAISELGFMRALGPSLAIAVAIALLVAITLVPALLALAGHVIFWPGDRRHSPQHDEPLGFEYGAARLLARRWVAGLVALAVVLGLLAASTGWRELTVGLPLVGDLPHDTEAARAASAASRGFASGITSPTVILLRQSGIAGKRSELDRLQALIAAEPGVAGVVGPRQMPTNVSIDLFLTRSGDAARLIVIFRNDPLESTAIGDLNRLRGDMPQLLTRSGLGGAQVGFAGDTAVVSGTIASLDRSLPYVAIAIAIVYMALMAILLRSLVAPLYLLFASALSAAAPLGLTAYLFFRLGHESMAFYVPLAVAVLLVSLGSDYNLFVAGRIWEVAAKMPLRQAIPTAVPQAAHAISAAALTLGLSFALLAIVPLASFREFAFGMALGVLIDSFVVRRFLVPALVSLVGNGSFWPRSDT